MSHTTQEILSKFKEKFPPVSDPKDARFKFSTIQVKTMITDLMGDSFDESESLFDLMKANGYNYHPEGEDGSVVFRWLIG
jgi:hypothetical protein